MRKSAVTCHMSHVTCSSRGIATLPTVMILGVLSLMVAVSVTTLSFTEQFMSQGSAQSSRAQFYAEAGARDALIKISRDKSYLCEISDCYSIDFSENGCTSLNDCAKVSIGGSDTAKVITSKGIMKSSTRILQVNVTLDTNGAIAGTSWSEVDSNISPVLSFSITASAGLNGSISPLGVTNVSQGNSQVYTITPDSGYSVETLTVDGLPVTPGISYTFTDVQAAHTISATFVFVPLPTYNITSSAGSNGNISPLGVTNVIQGASQAYTITPNTGYDIATLTIDGSPMTPSATYTFTNVQTTHTISATFSAIPSSVVEFMHQYIASTDPTGYTFGAQAQVGDVVLVFVQNADRYVDGNLTHATVRDSLGNTYVERNDTRATRFTDITVLTAPVTTAGSLTLYINMGDPYDQGFNAYLLRGFSSAVPNDIGATADVITSPDTIALTTTQQTGVFVAWGNEWNSTFSSWTAGLTQSNYDTRHYDATAYQLHVPAGNLSPGYNLSSGLDTTVLTAVALPENM